MTENDKLKRFGFSFGRGGVHAARTMMLEELDALLSCVDYSKAEKPDYSHAIEHENCLGKRSRKTQRLTCRHLVELYSLDPSITLFRTLLFFWQRDTGGRPLLALLCTYARDSIFRSTASLILKTPEGATVTREMMEEFIESQDPGRFSMATLKSTAQNVNSSWTKSGHLKGRVRKIRTRALPTAGSVSYALLLGYLTGVRGESLLQTEYARLLDCSFEKAVELAEEASRKGWIVVKRAGDIIEVLFPNLLTAQEMEWVREQS